MCRIPYVLSVLPHTCVPVVFVLMSTGLTEMLLQEVVRYPMWSESCVGDVSGSVQSRSRIRGDSGHQIRRWLSEPTARLFHANVPGAAIYNRRRSDRLHLSPSSNSAVPFHSTNQDEGCRSGYFYQNHSNHYKSALSILV